MNNNVGLVKVVQNCEKVYGYKKNTVKVKKHQIVGMGLVTSHTYNMKPRI